MQNEKNKTIIGNNEKSGRTDYKNKFNLKVGQLYHVWCNDNITGKKFHHIVEFTSQKGKLLEFYNELKDISFLLNINCIDYIYPFSSKKKGGSHG